MLVMTLPNENIMISSPCWLLVTFWVCCRWCHLDCRYCNMLVVVRSVVVAEGHAASAVDCNVARVRVWDVCCKRESRARHTHTLKHTGFNIRSLKYRTAWLFTAHTLLIHYSYTVHTLLIHCSYTAHTLFLHYSYPTHILFMHCSYIAHTLPGIPYWCIRYRTVW